MSVKANTVARTPRASKASGTRTRSTSAQREIVREAASLRSKLERREAKLEGLQEKLAEGRRRLAEQATRIAKQQAALEGAEQARRQAEAQRSALGEAQANLSAHDHEDAKLRRSLRDLRKALATRERELEDTQRELAEARRAPKLRAELGVFEQKLASAEEILAARTEQIAALHTALAATQETLAVRRDEIAALEAAVQRPAAATATPPPETAPAASPAATHDEPPGLQCFPWLEHEQEEAPSQPAAPEITVPAEAPRPLLTPRRPTPSVDDQPAIHRYWRRGQIRSKLSRDGVNDVDDFYLGYLLEVCRRYPHRTNAILSIGTAGHDLDVELARRAREAGAENFNIHCLSEPDPTPREDPTNAAGPQLAGHLSLIQSDIRSWQAPEPYSLIIANESLHHLGEPALALDKLAACLDAEGTLLTSTPIGRWDRMESPVAAEMVEQIWKLMPESYRHTRDLEKLERRYPANAASEQSRPWSRCSALLPELMSRFHFEVFIAYGNVINAFIDPEIGPNFDPDNKSDRSFIDQVAALDDGKIDAGLIPPTHLLAALRTSPVWETTVYRHWTPEFCLGRLRTAPADAVEIREEPQPEPQPISANAANATDLADPQRTPSSPAG